MKMTEMKSALASAAVLAFLAAGGAAFAQDSGPAPAAERGTGLYGYFNDPKVVKGGTVSALSLDAATGEVSVEIDCGGETVEVLPGSGVQFFGGRSRHRPEECGVRGRSCRDWNPPADMPRHHGWRHEAAERRAYHHPEAGAADCVRWNGGRPEPHRTDGCPFQIGGRVLLIYSADGSSLEAVKGF